MDNAILVIVITVIWLWMPGFQDGFSLYLQFSRVNLPQISSLISCVLSFYPVYVSSFALEN